MAKKTETTTTPATTTARPEIDKKYRANVAPADIVDQLKVDYIKPRELAGMGRFNITDAYERNGEFGFECCFEVVIVEPGELVGARGTITLRETPVRRRLVSIVRKAGVVGPYTLVEVGREVRGNQPWGFVPADGSETVIEKETVASE